MAFGGVDCVVAVEREGGIERDFVRPEAILALASIFKEEALGGLIKPPPIVDGIEISDFDVSELVSSIFLKKGF